MDHLLTYLIGHNNPINGFRPAAAHPSRRLCSLRAYASWLHQSMTGLPRFGLSNGYKVVLFADFRRSPHQIPVLPEHSPPYERHGRASHLLHIITVLHLYWAIIILNFIWNIDLNNGIYCDLRNKSPCLNKV